MPKLGLSLGIQSGAFLKTVQAFDADYQAVLNRATALSYGLPSASVQTKQNQLVVDLKASGAWAKFDVFYMFANDGTKEFATLNWKSPTANQASVVGSLTWNSAGYVGAASSYLNTSFNPTSGTPNISQNNACVGVWKKTHDATANKYLWGNAVGSSIVKSTSDTDARLHQTGGLTGTNPTFATSNTGLLILNRTGSTAITHSVNGVNLNATSINTSIAPVPANYTVFTYAGAAGGAYLGQLSSWFIGASIVSETSAFYTAMSTYMANF
jgi:hypothetical protein